MNYEQAEKNLKERLADNPCRGIVLGMGEDRTLRQFSWIMGRSSNSQNRFYQRNVGGVDLRTAPADVSKVEDPRLIIYNAMNHCSPCHIVSNGDQTDTVSAEFMERSHKTHHSAFVQALDSRFCEPDAPTFTPRITGYQAAGENIAYLALLRADPVAREIWTGVVKSSGLTKDQFKKPGMKDSEATEEYNKAIGKRAGFNHQQFPTIRSFFELPLDSWHGFCLTTYKPGSKALDSFEGEPFIVPIFGSLEESAMNLWNHLDDGGANWRVAFAGKEIQPDGEYRMFVHNTRQKV
ncbi:MAG: hypothetical protein NTW67_05790 [Candidatus Woesearchaeota archaeon]|nr:hypothetical protein [Candidatus Woesearchaeota archaeon]